MYDKKIYWSISEVSELLEIEPSILRFWEKEFSILSPAKNRSGNRSYQKKDIEIAQKIKYLLYEEGFTAKGAVKRMKKLKSIPLEYYIKTQKLILDKEFSQDFEKLCENLTEFVQAAQDL